jgi:hypothetical protein
MQTFTIHWSPVPRADESLSLFALWPAPVNPDVCFQKAGFTDFGDGYEKWDADAGGVLTRLLGVLGSYGSPRLLSKPASKLQPWYLRFFTQPEVLGLREQI